MIYGYCRVSTRGQIEGNSLEQQEKQLIGNGADEIIKEQYTGTTIKRPKFDKLIEELKTGDTLMVTKLDRFARSTIEGMQLMNKLLENGVTVKILNFGAVEGGFTSSNKLMFNIFLAFAEFERDMIVQRTQEGKTIAKQKPGFKEGRPKKYIKKQLDNAIEMLKNNSYTEVVEITGMSKSTLIREVRKRKAEDLKHS